MDIHTNLLTETDIINATKARGMRGVRAQIIEKGSRSRDRKFDVKLFGNSKYRAQNSDKRAATWDEWGIVLEELFRIDPEMTTTHYKDHDEFEWVTGGRFYHLQWEDQHLRHKWDYHAPRQFECECGASQTHKL